MQSGTVENVQLQIFVTGKDVRTVNSTITVLEMKGLLQTAIGKVFVAK